MKSSSILFLASDLGPSGAARQLALLAPRLAADGFLVAVAVLGKADTPVGATLRAAGVQVYATPLRLPFDVRGWRALRTLVAAVGPRVVHAWGPAAVRVGRVLCRWGGPTLFASAAADPEWGVKGWVTARALWRAERVVAASWAEAERYRRLGVCGDNLTRIAPGVAPAPPPPDRDVFLKEIGLPPAARFIATAGRIEPSTGLKAAVWAFDMLRYDFADLHLVVFGGGRDRAGLEAFGRALAFDDFRVHFPGPRADLPAVLGLAEAVWVTQPRGGVNLALEAMAAGRPVVGWNTPDLAEVVEDSQTGLLVGVGEKAQVAAATHGLLTDPVSAGRVGLSGKARAGGRFAADRMAAPYARVYHELPRR
ncbi:MAG TPA: glycosyltransferase [Urbifossiella sp.]|jgi:glycosyltransferase involved in cell wall biosynthesis|nr:glycosyltransferase [Urbifossiella sp.]